MILQYMKAWPFFLASILFCIIAAFLTDQYTPAVYKTEAKFLIKEEHYAIDLFENNNGGRSGILPKGQKIANESIIIKSRSMAANALDQLPFDIEYYREGFFIDSELYKNSPVTVEADWSHPQLTNGRLKITWNNHESFQIELLEKEFQQLIPEDNSIQVIGRPELPQSDFSFGKWVEFPNGKLLVKLKDNQQTGSIIVVLRDRESLIQQYTGDNLQVAPADKTSSILSLTLDTRQPYKGRDYLNMLMKVFLESELDEKNTIARNTIGFIDSQLSGISDSLNYTGNKLENYRSRNLTYNTTTEGNTLFEKLSELEKSLSQEKFKHQYFLSLQQNLAAEQYSEIVIPSGLGIEEPMLNKLIHDLVSYQADRSRFLATQTENSPAVIEVTRKIRNLKTSIIEAVKNANHTTTLLIADLSKRISKIEGQFGKLPQTEQDVLNIRRRYSLNESIYTFLLQRRAEASIILASNTPSNKIIEEAVLNVAPMRLRPLLNYFLALIVGLLIPVFVIFLKDFFSVKIQDLREAERKLAIPVIGYIGQNKKMSRLVVLRHSRARITEAFRAVRANIDFIATPEQQLTILITSSIAGEGKSFCALNLASVYSACEKKTVIVSCDLHKPFSVDNLGVTNGIGLSNFLSGQANELNEIIQGTAHPYLDVVVPGPVPPNPAELLIGDRFKNLLLDLKHRYDVIVLDSSPVGLTHETLHITRMVDLTIFILRQNYSNKGFIENINRLKETKKIKKLYGLINDIAEKDLPYKGAGYGYYDDEAENTNSIYRRIANLITNKAAI